MAKGITVVHYVNQFFGGIGGEEKANSPVQVKDGPVGPGRALQQFLGQQGQVVATIIAGDNYFNEEKPQAVAAVKEALKKYKPSVVVAGPALNAGRYGLACGEVCRVAQEVGIPAVTAMYPENPGVLEYGKQVYIVPTGDSPSGIQAAVEAMGRLALKLARGVELGPAEVEGYMPRGVRRPGFRDRPAAVRAADMLLARLAGKPFATELPIEMPERVEPAPAVKDLKGALLGLVTTGGLVPKGNPDRLVRGGAKEFFRYSIEGLNSLSATDWESVHRGFYTTITNQNPNYILPLNLLREMEKGGAFRAIHPWFFSTSGVGTAVGDSKTIGVEMGQQMVKAGVRACILVAT